jgi:predicted porin
MKKSLLAAAALAAVSGVAQAGVELYGVLDVAVGTAAHQSGADAASPVTINVVDPIKNNVTNANTWNGMVNGGISQSRIGIKGSEDMGNGMNAIFTLEGCISAISGSICNAPQVLVNSLSGGASATAPANNNAASSADGQLFGRKAFVGIQSDKYGTVTFGRNEVLGVDVLGAYAPVQNAQQFAPTGYSGTLGGSLGETEFARLDNSVKYTGKSGEFNYGVIYGFGNRSGSNSAGTTYQVNAGYESGALGLQAVYGEVKDAYAGTAAIVNSTSGIALNFFNLRGFLVAAKYKATNEVTLKAGYERWTQDQPSNPSSDLAMSSYYGLNVNTWTGVSAPQSQSLAYVGVDYQFSDKLQANVGYFSRNYETAAAQTTLPGFSAAATNAKSGLTANFSSVLLDYSLSKRTDVYTGAMFSTYSGVAAYPSSNSFIAAGIRHKF